ncbi:hypothetical protein ABRP72_19580 [Pectobacterium carotovorum]|uniref:hypothetical protein n=1 Tax=Pectobacterium carotovorum TaxID=554 RepID=UPI0032ED1DEE
MNTQNVKTATQEPSERCGLKTKPLRQYEISRLLDAMGFSYHDHGTLSVDGRKTHRYFKGELRNGLTRDALKATFPDAELFKSSPSYAPEISHVVIAFPMRKRLHVNQPA